ncbi:hypothetical protein [Macrococcus capreoli]|uniref:hypothetical protein n=1 Tax=Macrococcus capreoli TaxID=2982690 RepID=UPI003F440B4B
MNTVNLQLRITTCVAPDPFIFNYLSNITDDLNNHYKNVIYEVIDREKLTIKKLFETCSTPLLVILHKGIILYTSRDNKIFYHENTTRVKYKAYIAGKDIPPLINLIQDPKVNQQVIIDATMGMANDLTLMALTMTTTTFFAFEENFYIHFAVKWGMLFHFNEINKGGIDISRIHFIYGNITNHIDIFSKANIIYLDPMYEETITTSNIASLRQVTEYNREQNIKLLNTIFKSFKGKIILRAHYKSHLIDDYGFNMTIRKQSKTHYGYLYHQLDN